MNMSSVELKARLVALIEQEENLEKLSAIESLLRANSRESYRAWEQEELTRRTKEAEEDAENGEVLDEEQVNARFQQFWAEK